MTGREVSIHMTSIDRIIREINEIPDPYFIPCISCRYTGDIHAEYCPVGGSITLLPISKEEWQDFEDNYIYNDDSTDMDTRGGIPIEDRYGFAWLYWDMGELADMMANGTFVWTEGN